MTKEQLETMFLAEEAWDKHEADKDMLGRLVEAITTLNETIASLNEVLKD